MAQRANERQMAARAEGDEPERREAAVSDSWMGSILAE